MGLSCCLVFLFVLKATVAAPLNTTEELELTSSLNVTETEITTVELNTEFNSNDTEIVTYNNTSVSTEVMSGENITEAAPVQETTPAATTEVEIEIGTQTWKPEPVEDETTTAEDEVETTTKTSMAPSVLPSVMVLSSLAFLSVMCMTSSFSLL